MLYFTTHVTENKMQQYYYATGFPCSGEQRSHNIIHVHVHRWRFVQAYTPRSGASRHYDARAAGAARGPPAQIQLYEVAHALLAPVEAHASSQLILGRSSSNSTECSALMVPVSVRLARA